MTVTRESSLHFKTGMLQVLENYCVTHQGRESGDPLDNPISLTCGRHHHSILLGHNSHNQLVSWKVPFLWFNSIFSYPFHLPSPHFMLSFALKNFNLTSSHHITAGDVAGEFHCGSLKTKSSFHLIAYQILHFTGVVVPHYAECDFHIYFGLLHDTVRKSGHIQWVLVTTTFRVLRLQSKHGFSVWRVAANMLNKQWMSFKKGSSSSCSECHSKRGRLPAAVNVIQKGVVFQLGGLARGSQPHT